MSLIDVVYGYVQDKKEIKLIITEREGSVDFLVQEQGDNPDKELESKIWEAVAPVLGNKYGVSSWTTKRVNK